MTEIDAASPRIIQRLPSAGDEPTTSRRHVFTSILRAAAGVAARSVPVAGPVIGAVVESVVAQRSPLLGPSGGTSETLAYLELQRQIERETRLYEATSNVMKARHDATMSSIRNIKS